MPPSFALPPRIQKMSSKEVSAFSVESALVALESLMKSVVAAAADLLHAMRQAREAARGRAGSPPASTSEGQRDGDGGGRVLRIVRAAQRADAREVGDGAVPLAVAPDERRRRPRTRRRASGSAEMRRRRARRSLRRRVGDRAAHRRRRRRSTARSRLGDQPLLDRRVVLHRAVPVEMVGRDVEQHADRRARATARGRSGTTSISMTWTRFVGRRLERQDRGADIAAHLHVAPGLAQDVGDERRRRRLAVGAGDGDERRVRRDAWPARGRTARCRR